MGVTTYRAEWVLPVTAPAIHRGEVVVEDGCIAEVRPAGTGGHHAHDFGEAVLMPGLVNVHTHLELTVMRGVLEDVEFFPWIRELTARKGVIDESGWRASATWGAAEAVAAGVTTIGDCTDSGAALHGALALGLRGIIYQEVFGIDPARTSEAAVEDLNTKLPALDALAAGSPLTVGISPHAPYTVRPDLMRTLGELARASGRPLCIHAAESQAEAELIRRGTGPFAEMYARRGIPWKSQGTTAVEYLDSLGVVGPRTLLVHGVQIAAGDRNIVEHQGAAWAHCPKSNAKLGAGCAPLGLLGLPSPGADGGESVPFRIGLGSDSVVSNNSVDMFEEMRFGLLVQRAARRSIGKVTARQMVEMATIGGARALGMDRTVGSLAVGKRADMCAVGLRAPHAVPAYDPYSALVYAAHASDVVRTIIGGRTVYDAALSADYGKRFTEVDIAPVRAAMEVGIEQMRSWRPS